ncbi:MAG: (Fe-S)-binding protein [Bacteroidia bacterium]|nr:(Fe-S)-binding protein [Bacteroidia bacterium]
MKQIIFLIFLLAAFGFFGYTIHRLYSFLSKTKPLDGKVDNIGARIAHTLRVAFGQSKILRKWQIVAGAMHATIFWGFLVITVGTGEMILDGVLGTERVLGFLGPVYDVITISGEVFAALIVLAVFGFLARRYIKKPKRFIAPEMKPSSNMDATIVLIMTFLLMVSLLEMNLGYLLVTPADEVVGMYPITGALAGSFSGLGEGAQHLIFESGWWIHIVLVLLFLNLLPYSKHFHVMASIPNVFLMNMGPKGKLSNMQSVTNEIKMMMDPNAAAEMGELPPPSRFGIKDVEDASWKTVLDSYTCTECGRCTASCPANITGKKLSPRKLFKDVRHRMTEKGPGLAKATTEKPYDDGKSLFDYITPEELWACTSCGACVQECPVEIQHIPLIVDMRRYLVMEESKAPEALLSMFNNIENNGCPWPMPASSRFDWANHIEMPANLVSR